MAAVLVQSNSGTSTTATTTATFSTAPTSGNLIVLGFASDDYNGTPDSGWTQSTGMEQQTFHGGYVWWRISTGSNSFPYTIGSAARSTWVLAEFSGVDPTPYDVSNGTFTQASGSTQATPTITPATGNKLLVAMIGGQDTNSLATVTQSWSNSFTNIRIIGAGTGATNLCTGLAYRLVTGNGSTGYTSTCTLASLTNTQSRSGLIISLKEAAGGTNVSVNVTGNSVTASVGTAVVGVAAVGNSVSASVGTATVAVGVRVSILNSDTTLGMTASVGRIPYSSRDYAVAGAASGYVIDTGGRGVMLGGFYITPPKVVVHVSATISGQALSSTVGTATVGLGVGAIPTGTILTVATGTVQVHTVANVSLTGQELVASVGDVNAGVIATVGVSGQALTVSVGNATVGESTGVQLNGLQLQASVGTISLQFAGSAMLEGLSMTADVGQVYMISGTWTPVTSPVEEWTVVPSLTDDAWVPVGDPDMEWVRI